MDVVVPLVFPDYLIHVDTPEVNVEVPDLLPWFDVLPDKLSHPLVLAGEEGSGV